jgi:hypothetical protein
LRSFFCFDIFNRKYTLEFNFEEIVGMNTHRLLQKFRPSNFVFYRNRYFCTLLFPFLVIQAPTAWYWQNSQNSSQSYFIIEVLHPRKTSPSTCFIVWIFNFIAQCSCNFLLKGKKCQKTNNINGLMKY